jgi:hypothetical protein
MGEKNDNGNPSTDKKGGLNFFKNIGSIGNPDFDEDEKTFPNTDILGQVYTRTISDSSGETSPYFFYSEGELMLAAGSRGGNIYIYDDIPGNLYGAFNEVYSDLPILNVGRRSSVALHDLDNDGFHEIIVGNDNGGLMAFNTTIKSADPVNTTENIQNRFTISPNPVSDILFAKIDNIDNSQCVISNVDGKIVKQSMTEKLKSGIDVSDLPQGIYILSIKVDNGLMVEKFIKY